MWEEREEAEQLEGCKCQELRWAWGGGEQHVPLGPAGCVLLWKPSDGNVKKEVEIQFKTRERNLSCRYRFGGLWDRGIS